MVVFMSGLLQVFRDFFKRLTGDLSIFEIVTETIVSSDLTSNSDIEVLYPES